MSMIDLRISLIYTQEIMTRLPTPGQDDGARETLPNDFLAVEHNDDGSLKKSSDIATAKAQASQALTTAQQAANATIADGSVTLPKPTTAVQTSLGRVDTALQSVPTHSHSASQISGSTTTGRAIITASDTAVARGTIGASTSNLTLGTTSNTVKAGDYVPTKSDVGPGDVDNTSDANKPCFSATNTALVLKAPSSSNTTDAATMGYVDSTAAGAAITLGTPNNPVTNASATQPSGLTHVYWMGVTQPTNWITGGEWINNS